MGLKVAPLLLRRHQARMQHRWTGRLTQGAVTPQQRPTVPPRRSCRLRFRARWSWSCSPSAGTSQTREPSRCARTTTLKFTDQLAPNGWCCETEDSCSSAGLVWQH